MLFSSFTVTSNKRQREGASLLTMGATFNYNYMPVASFLIWKPGLETQRKLAMVTATTIITGFG